VYSESIRPRSNTGSIAIALSKENFHVYKLNITFTSLVLVQVLWGSEASAMAWRERGGLNLAL
jgi:hypothetical protein